MLEGRAYALGLGLRGRTAIRAADDELWEAVRAQGFGSDKFTLHLPFGAFDLRKPDPSQEPSVLIYQQDLCAAMLTKLEERYGATGRLTLDFNARIESVDALSGVDSGPATGLLIAAALAYWALKDQRFRVETRLVLSGIAVGLAIVGGWLATGLAGSDPFAPQRLESFTFVRPLGDTLIYLMTFSGATVTFGVGSVIGVVAGALAIYWIQAWPAAPAAESRSELDGDPRGWKRRRGRAAATHHSQTLSAE